jgi:hypothetical protein
MRLPAVFRYIIESHEHKIGGFNPMGAHGPDRVPILFHWTAFVILKGNHEKIITMTEDDAYLDKASDGLGHVLCESRTGDRPKRVAKIPCRDLTTPRSIPWPLVLYSIRYWYWYIDKCVT